MVWNTRNVLGWSVAKTMLLTGWIQRRVRVLLAKECVLSIYFHRPTEKEFEYCIRWLKKKGFNFLSVPDIDRIIHANLPLPNGSVLITVDDGWESNENNIVEVATRYNVPVTIFIATASIEEGSFWWSYVYKAREKEMKNIRLERMKKVANSERLVRLRDLQKQICLKREAMTIEQIKKITDFPGITIGSHSNTHPILINCNENEMYDELATSKEKLEKWTNKEVNYFAYPNGDYTNREIEVLQKLNYRLAFSLIPEYLTKRSFSKNYELPRFGFLEGASIAENICRITGVWKPFMKEVFLFLKVRQLSLFNSICVLEHLIKRIIAHGICRN